jgi:unsaturated rhamnogalacturonyl hydrolase
MKNKLTPIILLVLLLALGTSQINAQDRPWSVRVADSVMTRWKDYPGEVPGRPPRWSYEQGVVLKGIEQVWNASHDAKYFNYIQQTMDHYVNEDGTIRTYSVREFNLDNIQLGRMVLFLYKVTSQAKYRKAADLLREQLRKHPRTSEGGFWHKQIYPSQMWLDGLYMAEPFYAEYAATFHEDAAFDDIAKQFILIERHTRDPKTGLLYHGWDESRKQRWADPATGHSPNFWGRAIGWYAMALVDTLDYFPQNHPRRTDLIAILKRLAPAVAKYQDDKSGLWYEVVDQPGAKGNYLESSAAAMFVYAFAKGAHKTYLPASYLRLAEKGYRGMLDQFIETDSNGLVDFKGTVSVAGLGGNPYRDGSYEYYLSEKVVTNDPKGVGALLLSLAEIENFGVRSRKG